MDMHDEIWHGITYSEWEMMYACFFLEEVLKNMQHNHYTCRLVQSKDIKKKGKH